MAKADNNPDATLTPEHVAELEKSNTELTKTIGEMQEEANDLLATHDELVKDLKDAQAKGKQATATIDGLHAELNQHADKITVLEKVKAKSEQDSVIIETLRVEAKRVAERMAELEGAVRTVQMADLTTCLSEISKAKDGKATLFITNRDMRHVGDYPQDTSTPKGRAVKAGKPVAVLIPLGGTNELYLARAVSDQCVSRVEFSEAAVNSGK